MNPVFSIVIVSHNEGDNLTRTLQSIRAAIGELEYEVVVIDDGSEPPVAIPAESPPCRLFRFQRSAGLAKARHYGALLADGAEIVFLDAHMAVCAGWLEKLREARLRWGPRSVITPKIAHLDPDTWQIGEPAGQVLWLNENFDMNWQSWPSPVNLLPVVLGCCWILSRNTYLQVGGIDPGLTRWGCENIDLVSKVYAAGGSCHEQSDLTVGHLFREQFPYSLSTSDVIYNKLRTACILFSEKAFRTLWRNLSVLPGFGAARDQFLEHLPEIQSIRESHSRSSVRDSIWFEETFLPGLLR